MPDIQLLPAQRKAYASLTADSFGWSSGAVMFGESLVEPMGYPVEPEEA